MDDLLTVVATRKPSSPGVEADQLRSVFPKTSTDSKVTTDSKLIISSPEEALQALRSEPDLRTLENILQYLKPPHHSQETGEIIIQKPSPQAARLIQTIVNTTLPAFWSVLTSLGDDGRQDRHMLLQCLDSLAGFGALLARLRELLDSGQPTIGSNATSQISAQLDDLLSVLEALLEDQLIWCRWQTYCNDPALGNQVELMWREFTAMLCGGRLLSVCAEALTTIRNSSKQPAEDHWCDDGGKYARWLGRGLVFMCLKLESSDTRAWKAQAQMLGKALSLGYQDQLVGEVCSGLLRDYQDLGTKLQACVSSLQDYEQHKFFNSLLRLLPKRLPHPDGSSSDDPTWWLQNTTKIGGAAALLSCLAREGGRKDDLVDWLTSTSGGGVGEDIAIRRAVVAAVATDEERLHTVLERSLQHFGDKLYIQHTPVLHQEVNVQILLLTAGYIHRSNPMALFTLARSSSHLSAISNRLSAASQRSRYLGMVVGTGISGLIDKADKKMVFSGDEMDNAETRWYLSLTGVEDKVGTIGDLDWSPKPPEVGDEGRRLCPPEVHRQRNERLLAARAKKEAAREETKKVVSIEEIDGSDEADDDDGLPTYAKPDSDEEDEEEDATLVQRDRPTAPVYIRDLISYLRNIDSFEHQRLALSTAASLIRRKSHFGAEVANHIEELATIFTGLQDKFDMEDFLEHRQQAMMAILLAKPLEMGQWFAKTFFDGDYSIGQRAMVLTTLGLGGRELAGFKDDDESTAITSPSSSKSQISDFPSKLLPSHLHNIYSSANPSSAIPSKALPQTPIDALTASLQKTMLQPLAISAADTLTGPNALKVRTFSSRMEVEKRTKKPKANELAKIVGEGFLFPLMGRWWIHLKAQSRSFPTPLIPLFLKTLALLLHFAGPTTTHLPRLTTEMWDLLLSLRHTALSPTPPSSSSQDKPTLTSLLFAFLTLLNIHDSDAQKRRLAEEHAKELLETQAWAEMVFRETAGGAEIKGGEAGMALDEGEQIRQLAAGVIVRSREVVEKYQRLMVGDLFDY
ncbi:MAG: telomere binding protein [Caeruleum heppii]|nr:MAG: telomere binding protein [Caeruleum heppii]